MSNNASSNHQTVAGVILDLLWEAGVKTTFGIPGVHNLAFWDALGPNRPEIVGVRHEQTTAYAADGVARTTGSLGVALTTTGPGAANTLGAFGEAAISGSPVFVISSEAPIGKRSKDGSRGLLHEMDDQAAMFAPLAKKLAGVSMAISVTDGVTAVDVAAEMIRDLLRAPVGAGYLGIPADVLGQQFTGEKPKLEIGQEVIEIDIAAAQAAGKFVYVDFTDRWCATCQTNKATVFHHDAVLASLAQHQTVLLRGDWTNRDPLITAELARWNRSAVPFNLIYAPGKPQPISLPELLTPQIVLDALAQAGK